LVAVLLVLGVLLALKLLGLSIQPRPHASQESANGYDGGNAWSGKKEEKGFDRTRATFYNQQAWNWATSRDPRSRDGKKAVEWATIACKMTEWKCALYLDTLAAAYAETRDFNAAIKWQERALELLARDDKESRKDFGARLRQYQANWPYHQ